MNESINQPNTELSPNAPRIIAINIDPEKIGLIIGPGGKMIRKIEEESKATVVISDDNPGEIRISSKNKESIDIATNLIKSLVKEVEVGEDYNGKVTNVTNFGAFVELLPGKEGLLHISKIANKRVENVEEYLKVGDQIDVHVAEIDKQNRISLNLVKKFD
tara:strand:- start:78 stop:560 length:483 start_codon:yes stop_codon:yes gene_type:complete